MRSFVTGIFWGGGCFRFLVSSTSSYLVRLVRALILVYFRYRLFPKSILFVFVLPRWTGLGATLSLIDQKPLSSITRELFLKNCSLLKEAISNILSQMSFAYSDFSFARGGHLAPFHGNHVYQLVPITFVPTMCIIADFLEFVYHWYWLPFLKRCRKSCKIP